VAGSDVWLSTKRLSLRRFAPADLDWLASLYADPDVTRYLGGTKTRAQVESLLRDRILDYYEQHPGLGIWMTIERTTGQSVGFHVLNHIQGESIVQVGFILLKPAWGRGFASEMGEALLRFGFTELRLSLISGMASRGNVASQRALEKIGLRRNGERAFPHPAYASEGPMAWFERDAEAWLAERGLPAAPACAAPDRDTTRA
jgi:RimJ/RimL family protein N-acetyltransferase